MGDWVDTKGPDGTFKAYVAKPARAAALADGRTMPSFKAKLG